MKYSKLLDVLENDTSLEDLWGYYLGIYKFDRRTINKKQQYDLVNKIIPKLIIKTDEENKAEVKLWHNSPIFRLAYIGCLNMKRPMTDIFHVAMEIVNRVNEDDKMIAVKRRLIEYNKRYKDVEII
jgi:hypothetical protein